MQLQPPALVSPSRTAALRLALIPGIGPRTRRRLIEKFGTAEAVFTACDAELRTVERVGPKLCRAIHTAHDQIDVEAEIELCRTQNVQILTDEEETYPRLLRELPDPPGVLFLRGNIVPADS